MSALSKVGEWPLLPSFWRILLRCRYQLFQSHRHGCLVLEEVAGQPILVLPGVFNPNLFRTGRFLAESLDSRLMPPGCSVLDLGTGSGVGAVIAARWASRVVAVDINPHAVRCTRINALINQVEDRVEVLRGDLFEPVGEERFDRVLFNPPYYDGPPRDLADHAWRGHGVAERFAEGLSSRLRPGGFAVLEVSSDADETVFTEPLRKSGFHLVVHAERRFVNETLRLYRVG